MHCTMTSRLLFGQHSSCRICVNLRTSDLGAWKLGKWTEVQAIYPQSQEVEEQRHYYHQ